MTLRCDGRLFVFWRPSRIFAHAFPTISLWAPENGGGHFWRKIQRGPPAGRRWNELNFSRQMEHVCTSLRVWEQWGRRSSNARDGWTKLASAAALRMPATDFPAMRSQTLGP